MTPRLKFLSALLCVSIVYAIYDYIDRNDIGKPIKKQEKVRTKRARTAGATAGRKVQRILEKRKKKQEKQTKQVLNKQSSFTEISSEYSALDGWSRNPFVEVYEPKIVNKVAKPDKVIEVVEKEEKETFELNALDMLRIETAVRMGEKAFVTINGKTFREGDLINEVLIEKIENEQVTFKVGTTRIIKNVGI